MKSEKDGLNFTIEERILLHLQHFSGYRDEVEVPPGITQQGISRAVGIERKHVPRAVRSMLEKDLISERTARVKGKSQRMKTYFLSHGGEEAARRLKGHVRDVPISVADGKGGVRMMSLKEVCDGLDDPYTFGEVLSHLTPDGVFDVQRFREAVELCREDTKKDALAVYRKALVQAWEDGMMTTDERKMLRQLREALGVSAEEHVGLEKEILRDLKKTDDDRVIEVYRVALEQALADGEISEDERAILEEIRKNFNLRPD